MTIRKLLLLLLFFITSLATSKAQTPNKIKSILADKSTYKIDTVIKNVLIDRAIFSIIILRDKYDEHLKAFSKEPKTLDEYSFSQSPMTIIILKDTDNYPVYMKRFDHKPDDYPYINYSFYKGQKQRLDKVGKLYLSINKGYGGSGSQTATYFMNFSKGQMNLINLFNSNGELSYDVYSRNDDKILLLEGIWGSNEGHFENHRYQITKYIYVDGSFNKKDIGQTHLKYSSLDEEKNISQILNDIKISEPSLLTGVNLSEFNISSVKSEFTEINPNSSASPIYNIGDMLSPDTKTFKVIAISSQTNVHLYQYIGEYKNKYYYGRQIGDIIVGIKNGKIVTTIYNVVPEKDDVGVPSYIIELIQKTLPFPLAYVKDIYGVNIDNISISISRTNNAMTLNKDRIMFLTSVKQSILNQ